ncbi:MAG: bacterioferritin-associated ferredoxin [Nitrospirota bacterium]
MANQLCFCFGYTDEDIIKDVLANRGVSTILERIASEKKKGGCNCGSNHPLGR